MLNLRLPHPRRLRIGTEKGQKIHGPLQGDSVLRVDRQCDDTDLSSEVIFRVSEIYLRIGRRCRIETRYQF